ncbi:hypothetical protein AtEden1_Chr3g0217941 [Arabidopsis thaliana]
MVRRIAWRNVLKCLVCSTNVLSIVEFCLAYKLVIYDTKPTIIIIGLSIKVLKLKIFL